METHNRKILENECNGGNIVFYKDLITTSSTTTLDAKPLFPTLASTTQSLIQTITTPQWLAETLWSTPGMTTSITREKNSLNEFENARSCLLNFLNGYSNLRTIGFWTTPTPPPSSGTTETSPSRRLSSGQTLTQIAIDLAIEIITENATKMATKSSTVSTCDSTTDSTTENRSETTTNNTAENVTEKLTEIAIETTIDKPTILSVSNSIPMTTVKMTQGEPVTAQRVDETILTAAPDFLNCYKDNNCTTQFAHSTIFLLIIFNL